MNKAFLFLIFISSSIATFSQKDSKAVQTVIKNMDIQEKAWNNFDIPGFMNYYWNNDSLKFIGSKGITYGWKSTLDNYIKGYPTKEAMGVLKFTIIEAKQLSKTSVYVIGKWELTKDKPAGGYFTLLWKKINGNWVIVADHTS
jgi:ketosteroid isomerase-like protein